MDAPRGVPVETVNCECCPRKAPCPHCGKMARRVKHLYRVVTSIAYHKVRKVQIHYGEYAARCECCETFRTNPDEIVLAKAQYDNEVRAAVLERLIVDRMSVTGLRLQFQRDFYLNLSPGFIYDCVRGECARLQMADQRRLTLANFSGVLCVDELHLGQFTLLLATDPVGDFPVAFALVSANDKNHMNGFLTNLKNWGFAPKTVITDRSNLYPDLIRTLWENAEHQLCVFHVYADINKAILDALKRLRRGLARKGNRGRKKRRGRPTKAQLRARKHASPNLKEQAAFVFKHRYLITKRREDLTDEELEILETMYRYLPDLKTLRTFADAIANLFETDTTTHTACCRYHALTRNTDFQAIPELAALFKWFDYKTFRQTTTYLNQPLEIRTQARTNNHVERCNRKVRFAEAVRYKWRQRRSLVRFMVLKLNFWWNQRFAEIAPDLTPPTKPPSHAKSKTTAL